MTPLDIADRLAQATGGRYRIDEELGRGGMAVVFAATDLRLKRAVAIKVLPPELAFRSDVRERFLREAQMAAGLAHPNIVPVFAVEEVDGLVFMVMGRVHGETLAQRLHRQPQLDIALTRRILRETADALAHAHARGVVHRDIKPDNILLDANGDRVQVTDFGIARAAEGDARLTATGVAVGTPTYMSPEQARGEPDVDGRADLYSLGIVGYQMLAGTPPFTAPNTPALLLKHVTEPPPSLRAQRPDLPSALVFAVERALAKEVSARWPDASTMRDALADDAVVPTVGGMGRSALAAASRGAQVPAPMPSAAPAPMNPTLPPYPAWRGGGEMEREQWRRAQQEWRERVRAQQDAWMDDVKQRQAQRKAAKDDRTRPLDERLREFQRKGLFTALFGIPLALFLLVLNAEGGGFPWFLFAWMGIFGSTIKRAMHLWQDGLRLRDLVRPPSRLSLPGGGAVAAAAPSVALGDPVAQRAQALVGDEVLRGPLGGMVRRAVEDELGIKDTLASLTAADAAQLPDVVQTVGGLVDRIGSLARSLDRLDRDLKPGQITQLEQRLRDARALSEGSDRDRRVQLLERQVVSLNDLADRRGTLAQQLEHAALVLQTMRLDLLRLRSSGIGSASELHSVTQEARALSLDIERVVGAAAEVRDLR
jgi:hypothetical protein